MTKSLEAKEEFSLGLNCSQAVLSQYAEQYDLDIETACKLATGFGGGMGRQANTCGALTSAYMVLGLEFGSISSHEKDKKNNTYDKVKQISKEFESIHGSCECRGLLACDISTQAGQKQAREQHLHEKKCPKFVESVVVILDSMIEKNNRE